MAVLWIILLSLVTSEGLFFGVFDETSPSVASQAHAIDQTRRVLFKLHQRWTDAFELARYNQDLYRDKCQHVFCDSDFIRHQPASLDMLIASWESNPAHKWSPEQVVSWLQTIPIPLDGKQQLINANGLTGDILPSILLSASVSGLNESSFALLEERIFRLILFNWYPTLPLEAVVCATFCVFIVLYTSRLIIALDLSAFLANFERLTHLERCRSRLRTIKSRLDILETEALVIADVRSPNKSLLDCSRGSQRSNSISEANLGAVSVMHQIINVTIQKEFVYLKRALAKTEASFGNAEDIMRCSRFGILLLLLHKILDSWVASFDDDLDQLDTSISETGHRWRCMREAIDILKTLGDCQVKADSSNCFEECSVVLLEHDNVEEQPPSDTMTAAALNSGSENAMTDSEDVPMSVDEPTTPHYSTCSGPQIIYADENQPNDRVASFYLGDYKSKIPKPNLPAVRALGPSFLLMNPPANSQREGNSFSTPQHIPSEDSKQPTSMPPRLRRPKGGIPVASLTRPEGIFPSAAPWS